jgi:F5/8 type C domain
MRKRIAVTLFFALACSKQPEPARATATPARPPQQNSPVSDKEERGNLLNIALGASVVSRTAELTLDQSALRAIDGDPTSPWNSPPDDGKQQTMVFALPSLTSIEKVGLQTPPSPLFRVESVQVDSSVDGTNFTPLATLKLAAVEGPQLFPVAPPRDVLYLRITTLVANGNFARFESVHAHGKPLQPVVQKPIDGCWSVNGFESSFSTDRGRITGRIGGDHPISFDGGSDGVVYRFVWTSGPDWGFGAITTTPDGKHLSGLQWYLEPITFSAAESWFGERSRCGGTTQRAGDSATQFLQREKRLPLYGLHFTANGGIDEAASAATLDLITKIGAEHYKLVSREFRVGSAEGNRKRSQERLDALKAALQKRGVDPSRFQWQAIGSDSPPRPIETEIQRVLYSVIELQPL